MRSKGYHFRIISPSGEVLYDSAKQRANRFSTEGADENIGRSRLYKFQGSYRRQQYLDAKVETYNPDEKPKPQPFAADLCEVVFKFNGGRLKVITRAPFISFAVWQADASEPLHVYDIGLAGKNRIKDASGVSMVDVAQLAVEEAIEFHNLTL